jgi:hypothetical protein
MFKLDYIATCLSIGCGAYLSAILTWTSRHNPIFYIGPGLGLLFFCISVAYVSKSQRFRFATILGLGLMGFGMFCIGPLRNLHTANFIVTYSLGCLLIYAAVGLIISASIPDMLIACSQDLSVSESKALYTKISAIIYPSFFIGELIVKGVVFVLSRTMSGELACGVIGLGIFTFMLGYILASGYVQGLVAMIQRPEPQQLLDPEPESKYQHFYIVKDDEDI